MAGFLKQRWVDEDGTVHLALREAHRDTESETKRKKETETDKIRGVVLDHRYFLTPTEHKEKEVCYFSIHAHKTLTRGPLLKHGVHCVCVTAG